MLLWRWTRTAAFVIVYAGPYLMGAVLQTVIVAWRNGREDVKDATD